MSFLDTQLFTEYIKILDSIKPSICIEVGAHDAEFSQFIINNNMCNSVYAFEASPFVYKRFSNQLINRGIKYINKAVASYNGSIEFYIDKQYDPEFVANNSIKQKIDRKQTTSIDIECTSLDSYFYNIISPNDKIGLWIDAEGSANEVLVGMRGLLLSGLIFAIFIETEHEQFWDKAWRHEDVDNYLTKHNMHMTHSKFQYIGQTNCIYEK